MKWIVEKENLRKLIEDDKVSYEAIGRMYNVSGAYIKKIAKRLDINIIPRRVINPKETFNAGKSKKYTCLNCGKEFIRYSSNMGKFCCTKCAGEYRYKTNIDKWKKGEILGTSIYGYSTFVRRYLFEKYNNKCQICGWGEMNPHTKVVPLQIHHIDGNSLNNNEDNLQLLCPNCHSLTDNFGSRMYPLL